MHKNNRLLKQRVFKFVFCLVAFFSLNLNVSGASFAYASFDWDKFYEENVDYWTDYCSMNSGDVSLDDCMEIVLSGKKKYYVKLYKLLAKYERKGYKLNDNIILSTTFFDLTPDTFSDMPDEYQKEYLDGTAYNIDDTEDIDAYNVDTDEEIQYYLEERDSLKVLIKHMFAYPATCDKVVATPVTNDDGSRYCPQGALKNGECVEIVDSYKMNYTEYLISKWNWIGRLFGIKDKYREQCKALGGKLDLTHKKIIDLETYWRFLKESTYFDKKVHLQNRYASILEETGASNMLEVIENEDLLEQYEPELIKIREQIIKEIQSILKDYEDYGGFADTPDSYIGAGYSTSVWWPIGSDEVTEENGILYAKGNPSSVSIITQFGQSVNPTTGEASQHSGIDIGGVTEGVTNVIAVKDGVVVYPTEGADTNCPSSSTMDDCGGGYGNYVIIQHNDGTYSLYGHLSAGSITVKANDSVTQGQVIGKVGSSGNTTEPQLHFEMRQGSNSSSSVIDPLNYISVDSPRPVGSASTDFIAFLHSWENAAGAPTNGANYVVLDDGAGIPTVGYGIALKYNVERFKKKGIDVTNMTFGDEIPITIVDEVEAEEINEAFNNVRNKLAENGITLAEYQIEALVSRYYNCGNINGFPDKYLTYGDTDALYDNYMNKPVTGQGVGYMAGLERRRKAEWQLFHYQKYVLNA